MNRNDPNQMMQRVGLPLMLLTSLFWLLLGQPFVVHPQSIFGAIRGTITDAKGAIIPQATVKVINQAENTMRELKADEQ